MKKTELRAGVKIFCNQSEFLPKELLELLTLNSYSLENFNPSEFNLAEYYKNHVEGSNELHVFFCFINYVQFSDLNQFTFLQDQPWYEQIKIIAIYNDSHKPAQDFSKYPNVVDYHYLSEPNFALIQKINIQISNYQTHKVWGVKVLILDHEVSHLKLLHQIFSAQSLLTICCANFSDAIRYLNKQVKLILVSEYFALHKKWNDSLISQEYDRGRICILDKGTNNLIHQIRANGYFTIFERPLKLESFMHIVLQNIRSTTTTIMRKKKANLESISLPIQELVIEDEKIVENLVVAEDYIIKEPKKLLNDVHSNTILKESTLNANFIQNIRLVLENQIANNSNHNRQENSSRIRIKKNEDFYRYAQFKLKWLLDDLFVNIAQLQHFPEKIPDQWFVYYQKDLYKAILSPMVLIQFLVFEFYNKRALITQCLNASVLCSQMLMRAIPNEFGEWPDKMEEEWNFKQKEHQLLMRLALSIRYDFYQNFSNQAFTDSENVLELNKTESDILLGFQWVSPFESSYEHANLARILKVVHRYMNLSTGVHSSSYSSETISTQEACFHILFDNSNQQHHYDDIRDLLFILKMWSLWQYHEQIEDIKKYPCLLAKVIYQGYKPIKIQCTNPRRVSDFQHLSFCKGCFSHISQSNLPDEIYYCRSGNEKLLELAKKVFGSDVDYEGFYDPEINIAKKKNLL